MPWDLNGKINKYGGKINKNEAQNFIDLTMFFFGKLGEKEIEQLVSKKVEKYLRNNVFPLGTSRTFELDLRKEGDASTYCHLLGPLVY